jgi:hypothetical protein
MIDEERALSVISAILQRANNDPERPWTLVEFPQGWLVREGREEDRGSIGGVVRVVEKDSGRVLRFPSRVPTGRIIADYTSVVDKANVEAI